MIYPCCYILGRVGSTPPVPICGKDAGYHLEEIEPGVRERRRNPFCPEHQRVVDLQNATLNDED